MTTTAVDDAFDAIVISHAGGAAELPAAELPATDRERAVAALATDHQHTHVGATGDLFRLGELGPLDTTWDGSAPLFRSYNVSGRLARLVLEKDTSAAIAKLRSTVFADLRGDDLFVGELMKKSNSSGFVVAGGCLATALLGTYEYSDIDLFLVGLTADEAFQQIQALGARLSAAASGSGAVREKRLDVFRTQNCVTFRLGQTLIQVILRLYGTLSELLHGFDLGSSAVAFDGEEFFFTSAGKFAYERVANVADPARRRGSYERRLEKYASRCFGVVFPNLAADQVRPRETLEFPTLRIEHPTPLDNYYAAHIRSQSPGGHSNYGGGIRYGDLPALALKNLECARVEPVRVAGLCGWAPYGPDLNVSRIPVTFEGLAAALASAARRTSAKIGKLEKALGAKATTSLVVALAHGRSIDFEQLAASLVASVRERAALPFKFEPMRPADAAADLLKGAMSAADWYGAHYSA